MELSQIRLARLFYSASVISVMAPLECSMVQVAQDITRLEFIPALTDRYVPKQ